MNSLRSEVPSPGVLSEMGSRQQGDRQRPSNIMKVMEEDCWYAKRWPELPTKCRLTFPLQSSAGSAVQVD